MGQTPFSTLLVVVSLLLLATVNHSISQLECNNGDAKQVKAGFWFAQYSHSSPISSINSTLYTHMYYYLVSLSQSNPGIVPTPPDSTFPTFATTAKSTSPSLKTLLAISTDDQQADYSNAAFSSMASDPNLRASFITSAINLARANGFDGLDLGWRFPSSPTEMAALAVLLEELRAQITLETQNSSSQLLLTATVYFSTHLFDGANDNVDYPVDAISSNVDWINALTFDYHKNSNVTAANAPLFEKSSHFSTSYGITSWLDAGIPPCKLVMGIPLFGRSWTLRNKARNGIGDAVVAAGMKQRVSNQTGLLANFEIEELLRDSSSVYVYDNETVSAYFHSGSLWVSFDSMDVVEGKLEFALSNSLLGYFLWPINFDDSASTISNQASEVWLRNYDSPHVVYKDGFEQASSPFQLPPEELAPTTSRAVSAFMQNFQRSRCFELHLYLLLFLFFHLLSV